MDSEGSSLTTLGAVSRAQLDLRMRLQQRSKQSIGNKRSGPHSVSGSGLAHIADEAYLVATVP